MKTPINARRSFLLAGLAVPAGAVAGPGDDAALIALAREVVAAHRAYVGSYEPGALNIADEKAREVEQDRLWDIAAEMAVQLTPMVPTTWPGFIAKARAAYEMAEKELDGSLYASGVSDTLTGSLLEDLAGVTRCDAGTGLA